jgi:hypothetical protein
MRCHSPIGNARAGVLTRFSVLVITVLMSLVD